MCIRDRAISCRETRYTAGIPLFYNDGSPGGTLTGLQVIKQELAAHFREQYQEEVVRIAAE
eukprot:4274541-Prorocentrum_lima.AAC.1